LALTLAFASLALAEDDAADPHHPHHVSVFLGGSAGHHEGFSGGVEYSYRVNRWFSLGPSIEVTDTSGEPTLLIAVFNLHPWRDLKLIFGPGVEWVNGEENAALRWGASWASISPVATASRPSTTPTGPTGPTTNGPTRSGSTSGSGSEAPIG
jgi:hypothetical protein